MTRAVDPTRPVHMAYDPLEPESPFDLGSWHYPEPGQVCRRGRRQATGVFDQSVSAYFVNVPELMVDPGLRDDWGRQYEVFWEKLWATPSILGGQAFNLNDDQYLAPGGPVTGNGEWGFVDPWRRASRKCGTSEKIHTPIKIHDGPLPLPAAGQPWKCPSRTATISPISVKCKSSGPWAASQARFRPRSRRTKRERSPFTRPRPISPERPSRSGASATGCWSTPIGCPSASRPNAPCRRCGSPAGRCSWSRPGRPSRPPATASNGSSAGRADRSSRRGNLAGRCWSEVPC